MRSTDGWRMEAALKEENSGSMIILKKGMEPQMRQPS